MLYCVSLGYYVYYNVFGLVEINNNVLRCGLKEDNVVTMRRG